MDQDVLAQVLRRVAGDIQQATDSQGALRGHPPAVVTEDEVRYAIASAFLRVADQLES